MNVIKPIPHRTEGPQPLLREVPPGREYPVEALGALRGAVEAVQGMTLAPIALPAQSALTVASLAVQGHADVETLGRCLERCLDLNPAVGKVGIHCHVIIHEQITSEQAPKDKNELNSLCICYDYFVVLTTICHFGYCAAT